MALTYNTNSTNGHRTVISPLPEPMRPNVLFRVICKDGVLRGPGSPNLGFDQKGDLWPMLSSTAPYYPEDFDDHLSWNPVPTPFISFFSDWDTAARRKRWMLRNGGKGVSILAIWSKDLGNLYDAHHIAKTLGYDDGGGLVYSRKRRYYWRRRQLRHHQYEYLHDGPLLAKDSHFLAMFESEHEYECICKLSADMWINKLDFPVFGDETQIIMRLLDQYRSLSPVVNVGKLWALTSTRNQPSWNFYQRHNGDISVTGEGREWVFRDLSSHDSHAYFHSLACTVIEFLCTWR